MSQENMTIFVLVCHGKSRFDGRQVSEYRRVSAARKILQKLDQEFGERHYILMGDFNDNPDDKSLNILETGDRDAPAGPETDDGPFLINLTEPLLVEGHVSHGRTSWDIANGRVNTIDPDSRRRNNDMRGTNQHSGDILFDQILIPPHMRDFYVAGSAKVYDDTVAVRGNGTTRASDHLPVLAEFVFESQADSEVGLRIAALLPDPQNKDRGKEKAVIENPTDRTISLNGWRLEDIAGHTYDLSRHGSVPANGQIEITMTEATMPLTNTGDDVSLMDTNGTVIHRVRYTGGQVVPGQYISFR